MKHTMFAAILAFLMLCAASAVAELKVWFLDVGQADAALIQCDGRLMMIDGGNADDSRFIYSFLTKTLQVSQIDVMVSTHPHEDHIGGLSAALNACSVVVVYSPVTSDDTKVWNGFAKQLNKQSLSITVPKHGDSFMLGSAVVTFLSDGTPDLSENDRSLVLRLEYNGHSFLFTGDIGFSEEAILLASGDDLHADVLKVGHHGSASSSSIAFLQTVAPEYAVISVGANNQFGHPSASTLTSLACLGIPVMRTDLCGTIMFSVESDTLTCSASPCEPVTTMYANCADSPFIANRNTHKLHRADCPSVTDIKEFNRVGYPTAGDAANDGYVGCKRCDPFETYCASDSGDGQGL